MRSRKNRDVVRVKKGILDVDDDNNSRPDERRMCKKENECTNDPDLMLNAFAFFFIKNAISPSKRN